MSDITVGKKRCYYVFVLQMIAGKQAISWTKVQNKPTGATPLPISIANLHCYILKGSDRQSNKWQRKQLLVKTHEYLLARGGVPH